MKLEAIWHQPLSHYASALNEHELIIRLRAGKQDLRSCTLFYGNRVDCHEKITMYPLAMVKIGSDELFDYFEVSLKSEYTRICYYFQLSDGKETLYYLGGRFEKNADFNRTEFFQFPYIHRADIAKVPSWAKSAIMYQIFPDSFASGYRQISQKDCMIQNKHQEVSTSINGGTIKGIQDNLDYLENLGINCIYLNPIFVAGAYHKYDIIDYLDIDPCFGNKEDLKNLVNACHDRGIRVILDGVFNHCSSRFFAFKDVLEKGEASQYKDWFYDVQFPVQYTDPPNYQAFAYVKEMPKLNTAHPDVIDYFCKVGTYWIEEADIDGWRLDVANEVNHDFWRNFRKRTKEVKPDALLIGEIWEDSEVWLNGDQFDSTMNYRFSNICREFFAQQTLNEEQFSNQLVTMLMRYQKQITYVQMNLLDSHDVPRFLYYCKNDERKLKLAALFHLTFIGIPSILYGDEKWITGATEVEYRRPMPWGEDKKQEEGVNYYQSLITLRKNNITLCEGDFKVVSCEVEKQLLIYERKLGKDCIRVILHNGEGNVVVEGQAAEWEMIWGEPIIINKNSGIYQLSPYSGIVLKKK